ncbi:MAG: hypothetical protein ACRDRT_00510 [Pseudonocardiaceae bacterium]
MSRRTKDDARLAAAVETAIQSLLPASDGGDLHLRRAVLADRIAVAAERLARAEVIAARDKGGPSWQEVGDAFGVSRQSAHERFRTGPDGMHSRLFKRTESGPASNQS